MKAFFYDLLYRVGAPWEGGPREELVELVTTGRLSPAHPGVRAVDLGCGSGSNAIFLAQRGFTVTGIDFSEVALAKARRASASLANPPRFIRGDLTGDAVEGVTGAFDLLVDYGTLDDLKGERRLAMAATITRLSAPGSAFLLWCFYGEPAALPRFSFTGPSRPFAGLGHGEEKALFGDRFDIETIASPRTGEHGFGCFLMTRR